MTLDEKFGDFTAALYTKWSETFDLVPTDNEGAWVEGMSAIVSVL